VYNKLLLGTHSFLIVKNKDVKTIILTQKTTDFKPLFPTMSIKASSSSQKPNKTGSNQIQNLI